MNTVRLFGIDFYSGTLDEVLQEISSAQSFKTVFTPNPEQIILANHHPAFLKLLQQADYNMPDGVGIVWASSVLARGNSEKIPERLAGREIALHLAHNANTLGKTVFFLGGKGDVAHRALRALRINGKALEGYIDTAHPTVAEDKAVFEAITQAKPWLVLVGFGAPHQEDWVIKHKPELEKAGVKVAMVVGGAFDVWSGDVAEAPRLAQALGLEWLWRLVQQPWRIKRQLALVSFVATVVKMKFSSKR